MPTFDIYEELRAVVAAFEGRSLDYALCGAVALAVHGRPRATTDIDILVPADAVSTVKGILRGLGYDLEAAPISFAGGIRVHRVSRVADSEIMTVDISEATSVLDEVWTNRIELTWRDQPLRVVSRDGLVHMKRLADRPQDRADLRRLDELGARAARHGTSRESRSRSGAGRHGERSARPETPRHGASGCTLLGASKAPARMRRRLRRIYVDRRSDAPPALAN